MPRTWRQVTILNSLAIVAVIILVIVGWIKLGDTGGLASHACERSHELASSMRDIHQLLTLPPRPGAPPTPPNVERIVHQLNADLAAYLKAEHKVC